jgi:hypothetical protein
MGRVTDGWPPGWAVIEAGTSGPVDLGSLIARIRAAASAPSGGSPG